MRARWKGIRDGLKECHCRFACSSAGEVFCGIGDFAVTRDAAEFSPLDPNAFPAAADIVSCNKISRSKMNKYF